MKEEMDRAQAELDALKRTEEDLKRGHQKLEEMVTKLDLEMVHETFVNFELYLFTLLMLELKVTYAFTSTVYIYFLVNPSFNKVLA